MKNFLIGFLTGVGMFSLISIAVANDGDRSIEHIFNRVYNSATQELRIQ